MATATPKKITLSRPIQRQNGPAVQELTLREPGAGEMRGLKIFDLMQGDTDALIKLLPRIASPAIITEEVEQFCVADIAAVAAEVIDFFLTPAQQAKAEKLRAQMD